MKNFVLIGSAGYIAERHMKAVKETGNRIVAATDAFDVMGRMDSFFPEAEFFLDYNHFLNYLDNNAVDYASICSPNYLHFNHITSSLHSGANAICEKPLVIYPHEIEGLQKTEAETGNKVFNILQLRLHPTIVALRNKILNAPTDKIYDIDLSYITSRGKWYFKSWKGEVDKSGGIATNIGIHFFDMLTWIFGEVEDSVVHLYAPHKAGGFLQLKKARVRWFLSLDMDDIPAPVQEKGIRTYRSITIEGEEIEFSGGFTDLHTQTYSDILSGGGFGITDAMACIYLTHKIRNSHPIGLIGDYHPLLKR